MTEQDHPALQTAIESNTFHPGEWQVKDFIFDPKSEDAKERQPKICTVVEDAQGPIVFVRFTKALRICTVWADGDDVHRNARAIIFGLKNAVDTARANGFTEVIVTTQHEKLATFLTDVMGMTKSGDEYVLAI
jgi:hypothetical protein